MTQTLALPISAQGYTAISNADGSITILDVPIFVECERDEVKYDRDWLDQAVMKARRSEAEGYLPPLHIRHHEPSTAATNAVQAAGFFRIKGTKQITFKGELRLAILADLIVTDPGTQSAIMANRLPYRSVEIFDVSNPSLDGLALLDHEAPFLELPMLMVGKLSAQSGRVADATFANGWSFHQGSVRDSFEAYGKRGQRAAILFRNTDTNEAIMAADDKKTDDKGEKMADGATPDVGTIVSAIKDGSISVADMEQIMAAIAERGANPDAAGDTDAAAPAPAPTPSQSMSATPAAAGATPTTMAAGSGELAALMGKNVALEARVASMEAERKRDTDVAAALTKLEGRPLGSDFKSKLVAFHATHGPAAFATFVGTISETFAAMPATDTLAKATEDVSAVAMKFAKGGPGSVEKAMEFSRQWTELRSRNLTSLGEEAYVEANMARLAGKKL